MGGSRAAGMAAEFAMRSSQAAMLARRMCELLFSARSRCSVDAISAARAWWAAIIAWFWARRAGSAAWVCVIWSVARRCRDCERRESRWERSGFGGMGGAGPVLVVVVVVGRDTSKGSERRSGTGCGGAGLGAAGWDCWYAAGCCLYC